MSSDACSRLFDLIKTYETIAIQVYKADPEGRSIMVLTLAELWIACEKIAKGQIPLLEEYDPRIPASLLQCLLFPFRGHMTRLAKVEQSLDERCRASDQTLPHIFSSFGVPRSFAVRYYDLSEQHKSLRARIETIAAKKRAAKVLELSEVKAKHQRLKGLYESSSCGYVQRWNKWGRPYTEHDYSCSECSYKERMNVLNIDISFN